MKAPESERFRRVVFSEIDNLKQLHESLDLDKVNGRWNCFTPAALFTLSAPALLHLRLLSGLVADEDSNQSTHHARQRFDLHRLFHHRPGGVAGGHFRHTRYPNELIRLGKLAKRLDRRFSWSPTGPVPADPVRGSIDRSALAPHPVDRQPTTLSCLINLFVVELAARCGADLKLHQEKLEKVYLENDVLFNLR